MENTTTQPNMSEVRNHRAGSLAALAFILILFLIGLFFYGARITQENSAPLPEDNFQDEQSDNIADLEAELEALDVESLDTNDPEVEAELQATTQ